MPRHYDDDEDVRSSRPDFQFEVGTKGVLSLFGALAILCALFFSFGYTVGKHSVPASFSLADSNGDAVTPDATPAQKPAAGTPLNTPASNGVQPPNPNDLTAAEVNQTPQTLVPGPGGATTAPTTASAAGATGNSIAGAPQPNSTMPAPVSSPVSTPTAARPAPLTASNGGSSYAVQVFAGSKEGDALSLAAALKARQYPVFILRPVPGGDGLFHVQIGPYNSLPEAQQMRERLAADGYNAVIK